MELNVLERIMLLAALPVEGNYLTFKILMELKATVSFNEEEIKEFDIKETGGRITWDPKKVKDKKFDFGMKANEIIGNALKKLDEAGKINEQNASLYEKFMK